jgi:hypothetical protein
MEKEKERKVSLDALETLFLASGTRGTRGIENAIGGAKEAPSNPHARKREKEL